MPIAAESGFTVVHGNDGRRFARLFRQPARKSLPAMVPVVVRTARVFSAASAVPRRAFVPSPPAAVIDNININVVCGRVNSVRSQKPFGFRRRWLRARRPHAGRACLPCVVFAVLLKECESVMGKVPCGIRICVERGGRTCVRESASTFDGKGHDRQEVFLAVRTL